MSGFDYFKDVLFNKYAQFDGRARRKEYWYFTLFNSLIVITLALVSFVFMDIFGGGVQYIPIAIIGVYFFGVIVPTIAVIIRRLHDGGYSGWMMLIGFIPYIGSLIMLYFYVKDSEHGDNQYGPNPKGIGGSNDELTIQDNLI